MEANVADLPEIAEADIDTAPHGLYRVQGGGKRGDYYDAERDVFDKDVDLVLLVRIDGFDKCPGGAFKATVVTDKRTGESRRQIQQWVRAWKTRRHHNNSGRRQVRRGQTRRQVRAIARRLKVPYR